VNKERLLIRLKSTKRGICRLAAYSNNRLKRTVANMSMTDKVNEMDVISKIKEINQTNQINEIDEIINCLSTNVPIFDTEGSFCYVSRMNEHS